MSSAAQAAPSERPLTRFVVTIGGDVFPVRGNSERGWHMDASTDSPVCGECWYESLDELVFVLINLSIVSDGAA